MDNWGYLVAAYSIVWIAIFGYVSILSHRQHRMWREIDSLKARITGSRED